LYNRAGLDVHFDKSLARVQRTGGTVNVIMLDIDDFKVVNDTFGHQVGDLLLVELAHRLENLTRTSDTLCRFGGDEFLYLAAGLASPDEAETVARRLAGGWAEPFLLEGARFEQRASIGVVICDLSSEGYDQMLRDADIAMYEAKRRGKGRHVVFTPDMSPRTATSL
jgi:diguanylate cyclase (GGDEF)-like protein